MKPVLSKKDFARRYGLGEFGNASPTWSSVWEWQYCTEDLPDTNELYHLRNRIKGGPTHYNICCDELRAMCEREDCSWVHRKEWYVSAMAPTEGTLLQGEVQRFPGGLYAFVTRVAKPMRAALKESSEHVYGLSASLLLQENLNQQSYEWLMYLLDEYDDHVVEFSTYNRCWGTIPGFNTVFWEVRMY